MFKKIKTFFCLIMQKVASVKEFFYLVFFQEEYDGIIQFR